MDATTYWWAKPITLVVTVSVTILGTPRRFTPPASRGLVSVALVLPYLYRIYDTATGVTRLAFQ